MSHPDDRTHSELDGLLGLAARESLPPHLEAIMVYEKKEPVRVIAVRDADEEGDFLSGSTACAIDAGPECEACQ